MGVMYRDGVARPLGVVDGFSLLVLRLETANYARVSTDFRSLLLFSLQSSDCVEKEELKKEKLARKAETLGQARYEVDE